MTRYLDTFSWTGSIERFLLEHVTEKPLLNACAGRSLWGDVLLDRYEVPGALQATLHKIPNVRAEWTALPFRDGAFGAVFADPPWDAEYKKDVAAFMCEALRVAAVAYLMAPWIYGAAWADLTKVWVRQMPGVNRAILVSRYVRK